MSQTVADYLLERLRAWEVEKVFAYAGDGINGILAAFGRACAVTCAATPKPSANRSIA